jgi:diacylglycerol kinase
MQPATPANPAAAPVCDKELDKEFAYNTLLARFSRDMFEVRHPGLEGNLKTSGKTDSTRVDGVTTRPAGNKSATNLSDRLHIPFSWKVKAGRSASLVESFYHAFSGIGTTLKRERNFRVHLAFAALAIGLGLILKIGDVQWLAVTLAIGLVLTAEFINTAMEHIVDLVTERTYHDAAKAAKDTAAAAVLVAAICAVITGMMVFLPPLLNLLR